jgi:hypothetical protein
MGARKPENIQRAAQCDNCMDDKFNNEEKNIAIEADSGKAWFKKLS